MPRRKRSRSREKSDPPDPATHTLLKFADATDDARAAGASSGRVEPSMETNKIIAEELERISKEAMCSSYQAKAHKKAAVAIRRLRVPITSGAQVSKVKGISKSAVQNIDRFLGGGRIQVLGAAPPVAVPAEAAATRDDVDARAADIARSNGVVGGPAPADVRVELRGASVAVAWEPPPPSRGADAGEREYAVQRAIDAGPWEEVYCGTSRACAIAVAGVAGQMHVRVCALGGGQWSPVATVAVPAGPLPQAGVTRGVPTLLARGFTWYPYEPHVLGDELYVGGKSGLSVLDHAGTLRRRIGAGEFYNLAMGSDVVGETLFVADNSGRCVAVYERAGSARLRTFGVGELHSPEGLKAAGGRVYTADQHLHRVSMFNEDGTFVAHAGSQGAGPGQLFGPTGLFISDGRVFVGELNNKRVAVFRTDLSHEQHIGAGVLGVVHGVCVVRGLLIVADMGSGSLLSNGRITIFDAADGRHVAHVTGVRWPLGVTAREDGLVFITNSEHQLYSVQLD